MTSLPAPDPGIEMALRLRLACEAHDASIGPHLDRVTHYACELSRWLDLPLLAQEEMRHAAPLHDLGKIGLPLDLLNKPGRLTADEMDIVKLHTRIGYRILEGSGSPVMRTAAAIALSHHECWNGSGHPEGLAGTSIPLAARIVAVADVYDALASQRAYKPAWNEDAVGNEMRRLRGIKFDPDILDVFLARVPALAALPH